jgi:hypothetical protein
MLDPSEINEANRAAAAIAGCQLAQLCLTLLIRNGIVPKADAEKLLRQVVEANRTGGPGNRAAAEILEMILEKVSKIPPIVRQ